MSSSSSFSSQSGQSGLDLGRRALLAYGSVEKLVLSPLGDGLINETYLVEQLEGGAFDKAVLQRVSSIFGRAVHDDIEAITAHLAAQGFCTPRLYATSTGEKSVDLGADGIWRLMSFVPGHSHSVMTRALAQPAGELVGRFHAAFIGFAHSFHFVRPGAHDLAGHLTRLRDALQAATQANFQPPESAVPREFFDLAPALLAQADKLALGIRPPSDLPLRLCHGDLKLNNLRFDEKGQGLCLLDLDTLGYLPLAFELGDAFRSWCNPRGEDAQDGQFDLELFEEALRGYAQSARDFITPLERQCLYAGIERITLQLAVRFAVDVVSQNYFRWNRQRYPSRAMHNFVRATGQWNLFRSLTAARARGEAIVAQVFAP